MRADTTRPTLEIEGALIKRGPVIGVDEVGRGAVAGPVVVGAVAITSLKQPPETLNDSKKLSAPQREALIPQIQEWCVDSSIGTASADEIDRYGLALALALAAARAVEGLSLSATTILVDGSHDIFRPLDASSMDLVEFGVARPASPVTPVVRGDGRCATIAAASVIAKVWRDIYMVNLDAHAPHFEWRQNKGYLSPRHSAALVERGASPWHRRSWALPATR